MFQHSNAMDRFRLRNTGACAPGAGFARNDAPEQPRKRNVQPPYKIVGHDTGFVALTEYKHRVARTSCRPTRGAFTSAPLPEVMKSIVVLEITVDAAGRPTAVSVVVARTAGVHLEQRALTSVVKAAPFTPPAPALLGGAG